MILSKTHKFIFIKGVKVGGTSVEVALSSICGPDDIVTPITPIDELRRLKTHGGARNYLGVPAAELAYLEALRRTATSDLPKVTPPPSPYFSHMPLREVLHMQGPAVFHYQVVCVERNPYAKLLSWANHQLSFASYQAGGDMLSNRQAIKDYLCHATETKAIVAVKNIERYRRPDGLVAARVLRFEKLADDFGSLVRSLGIDFDVTLPHVKKGVLADRLDPRDFFDQRQLALINEIFLEEFETFKYQRLD